MKTLKQAVEDIGGITTVSAMLGMSPQRLSNWIDRGVPLEHCARVEHTLGVVTRRDMRPDDWHLIWPELQQHPDAPKEPAHG